MLHQFGTNEIQEELDHRLKDIGSANSVELIHELKRREAFKEYNVWDILNELKHRQYYGREVATFDFSHDVITITLRDS